MDRVMQAITFTLKLLEPLLATGLEGDPNSNVSLSYIPGSVLRGALIGKYLDRKPEGYLFDPANEEQSERFLFFDGTMRYLNAYPLISLSKDQEINTWPTPLSWHSKKDAEASEKGTLVLDLCYNSPAKVEYDLEGQSKQVKSDFFFFHPDFSDTIVTINPERRLTVHTQRERRHGRSTKDDGAVFRYEAIAAGVCFRGVILFDDQCEQKLMDEVNHLLSNGQLSLGGSRTAGYGRAEVTQIANSDKNQNWREFPWPQSIAVDQTFTITLLSNALIRDEYGHYQADLPVAELKKTIGEIKPTKAVEHGEEFNATFKRAEVIGGFNRKWGLPLPQSLSLKAGSVFTFQAKEDITEKKLKSLVDAGIGDRRVEGFGRIAVNLNQQTELRWRQLEAYKKPDPQTIVNPQNRKLAEQMLERILRQRLEQKLSQKVGQFEVINTPPNHQISRLRLVIRDALRTGDKSHATKFFDANKRTAKSHFDTTKVKDKNTKNQTDLQQWVMDLLNKLDVIEGVIPSLGADDDKAQKVSLEYIRELKVEYHLRLIDGVLARAAKENNSREVAGTANVEN